MDNGFPFCKVEYCSFPYTHITRAHRCRKCRGAGHGAVECRNRFKMQRCKSFWDTDILPDDLHCRVPSCSEPHTHTSEAHHCHVCGTRTQTLCDCLALVRKTCPTCRTEGSVDIRIQVFTDSSCVVCYEDTPKIIFRDCGHANLCKACMDQL